MQNYFQKLESGGLARMILGNNFGFCGSTGPKLPLFPSSITYFELCGPLFRAKWAT